jgi:L-asparaginase II
MMRPPTAVDLALISGSHLGERFHTAAVRAQLRSAGLDATAGAEDTVLMMGVPGLVSKVGAEGVMAVALPGAGAVALKIDDDPNPHDATRPLRPGCNSPKRPPPHAGTRTLMGWHDSR